MSEEQASTGEVIEDIVEPQEVQEAKIPAEEADPIGDAIDKVLDDEPEAEEVKEPKAAKAKKEPEPKEEPKAEKEPKEPEVKPDEASEDEAKADKPEEAEAKPKTGLSKPPARFDANAQGEWEQAPESVKGATLRAISELEKGLEKYRGTATKYEEVREFVERAEASGSSLPNELKNIAELDALLKKNPIEGLEKIVASLNLKGPNGGAATLRDIAGVMLGQKPEQVQAQTNSQVAALKQQVEGLQRHIAEQQAAQAQQAQEQKAQAAQQTWESFQREYPEATRYQNEIAQFLQKYPASGIDHNERLLDAYRAVNPAAATAAHTGAIAEVQTQQSERKPNPKGQKAVKGKSPGASKRIPAKNGTEAISNAVDAILG